jgi:hypothetical protein
MSAPDSGEQTPRVHLEAHAQGSSRIYQAARDLTVHEGDEITFHVADPGHTIPTRGLNPHLNSTTTGDATVVRVGGSRGTDQARQT